VNPFARKSLNFLTIGPFYAQVLDELVVAVLEVLKISEGRATSHQPYDILLRLYYQGRIAKHLHISKVYMERAVVLDCYRRFPWLPLSYLHFLEMTRHRWIHDTETRDSTREYLLRLLGRTEGKTLLTIKAEAETDLDLKVPALLLLAHIQRKANQFNLVIEVAKSGLEAVKQAVLPDGTALFAGYWRSFMILLAEAFHRTRQIDSAGLIYETVLKRLPTDPLALKARRSKIFKLKIFFFEKLLIT